MRDAALILLWIVCSAAAGTNISRIGFAAGRTCPVGYGCRLPRKDIGLADGAARMIALVREDPLSDELFHVFPAHRILTNNQKCCQNRRDNRRNDQRKMNNNGRNRSEANHADAGKENQPVFDRDFSVFGGYGQGASLFAALNRQLAKERIAHVPAIGKLTLAGFAAVIMKAAVSAVLHHHARNTGIASGAAVVVGIIFDVVEQLSAAQPSGICFCCHIECLSDESS